jgi:pimeloyl-ACP methyl ester carboxylesterase
MFDVAPVKRRRFLQTAVLGAAGLTAAEFGRIETVAAETASASNRSTPSALTALQPIRQVHAGVLDIGYFEAGPSDGQAVLLLHGFPYDIHSYVEVAPMLAAKGYRVIVPHLRGHGTTRFLEATTPRAGQQGAIGADVIASMDALNIPSAVLAGYDWGGRAACVAAALWPERCKGLVSVNGYLIQDIAHAATPIPAKIESGYWYQYYFQIERGREGLTADRRGIARVIWARNSPTWRVDDATFERTALAFDNLDYVDVVIHSYRHRLGQAPSYPPYEAIELKLAGHPLFLNGCDGSEDPTVPPTTPPTAAPQSP